MRHLVSIIIPCYNQGQFLEETLQSVFVQQYPYWECLLIDDGSTDETETIATHWASKDKRFRYFKRENSGVSATRNYGLQLAKGDYIQFLDADDILAEDKIERSLALIEEQNIEVVCTNYVMFDKNRNQTLQPFSQLEKFEFTFYTIARYWNDGFTIPIHCWFFNASVLQDLEFPVGLTAQEDWVMWLKVFRKNPTVAYIEKPLALYRLNANGRTQTSGFFPETLAAIHELKPILTEAEFKIVYESAIERYNSGMEYWKNRTAALKNSNTYQAGLIAKKVLHTMYLLPLAKPIFKYFKHFKS